MPKYRSAINRSTASCGGEGAALALLSGGLAGVPHLEVGDILGPTVEDVDQRNRPVGADQLRGRIDLDHGQAASLRGQRITGAGVGLFFDAEFIDSRLPLARSVTCGTGQLLVAVSVRGGIRQDRPVIHQFVIIADTPLEYGMDRKQYATLERRT